MRKLKLEDIEVTSFVTSKVSQFRGTVDGRADVLNPYGATSDQPEEPVGPEDPISKGCESVASWFGPPQVCCAF